MKCPICGREFEPKDAESSLPFCSDRCKTIDLGRWLDEKYPFLSDKDEEDDRQIGEGWVTDENH
ncbi:MAG: DNA gyrase inhibitor YacG [Thermoguttaceae bacterium]|nr:DNA gyrase inhibitor YacG [Thermoguttaceae bacterium]